MVSVTFYHPSASFSTPSVTDAMEKASNISARAADDPQKAPDSVGKAIGLPKKETNLAWKSDKELRNVSSRSIEANDDPLGALHA